MQPRVFIKGTDLQIARLNFGGNVFGWTLTPEKSYSILDHFVGNGFNFIDTADTYAWWVNGKGGQSEEIIGNWMHERKNRKDIVLATKVGSETQEHGFDISKKHILKSVDESLKRLRTDYIDLYYTHFDDNVTPIEETLSAYDSLIRAGKIRYIAASNISPDRLRASFEIAAQESLPAYVALQPHYNLMERQGFEQEYEEIAEEYNLSVFPYWALASGFLTGKYRSETDLLKSQRGGGVSKYLNGKGIEVLLALDAVAEKYQIAPAAVALAWLLNNPLIDAPIVSATSEQQLNEIYQSTLIELDEADLTLLDRVSRY